MSRKNINRIVTATIFLGVILPAAWAAKALVGWDSYADCRQYVELENGHKSDMGALANAECRKEIQTELAIDRSGFCVEVVVTQSRQGKLGKFLGKVPEKSAQAVAFRCQNDCVKLAERVTTKIPYTVRVLGGYQRQIRWRGTSWYEYTGKIEQRFSRSTYGYSTYQGNVDPVAVYCESDPNHTITKEQTLNPNPIRPGSFTEDVKEGQPSAEIAI